MGRADHGRGTLKRYLRLEFWQTHGATVPELAFLPKFPPGVSQLTLFGGLLLLGLVAGEAFRRYLALPRITGYAVAGVEFRAVAFVLLAANQALALWLGAADERLGYTYLLRVLGFVLILAAIVDQNLAQSGKKRGSSSA